MMIATPRWRRLIMAQREEARNLLAAIQRQGELQAVGKRIGIFLATWQRPMVDLASIAIDRNPGERGHPAQGRVRGGPRGWQP